MSLAAGTRGTGNYAGSIWGAAKDAAGRDIMGWNAAPETPNQGVAPTPDMQPGGYDTGSASGSTAGRGAQFQSAFGSKTGGPFGDYQNNLGGSGLRPLSNAASAPMESYTSDAAPSGGAGGSGSSGGGGGSSSGFGGSNGASYPGLSAAMSGLNDPSKSDVNPSTFSASGASGGGMSFGGLGGLFGSGSSVGAGPMVGAPGLSETAINSAPPQTPDTGFSAAGGSGAQQLSAPTSGRQGIGARIYPSLQALLKTPAY